VHTPYHTAIEDRDVTPQQPLRGDVAVLVPAAGLGTRLGPGGPKALRELAGASLLVHAVRRLVWAPSVGSLVVAVPVAHRTEVEQILAAEVPADVRLDVVVGGATRQASVAAALAVAPARFGYLLVHDAARAFAPPELVERVAAALREGHRAVIPVLDVVDTIKRVDGAGHVLGTVDRLELRRVQTPQGFHRDVLEAGHRAGARVGDALTDDAGLVELLGVKVFCVAGSEAALKITRPADLDLAELLLRPDRPGTLLP
jgi:2-C-methyl-D-erythritol 4-phosphate cytidylyltransferase